MWVVANINQYYTFRNSVNELYQDETKIYFPKINHEKNKNRKFQNLLGNYIFCFNGNFNLQKGHQYFCMLFRSAVGQPGNKLNYSVFFMVAPPPPISMLMARSSVGLDFFLVSRSLRLSRPNIDIGGTGVSKHL